MKRRLAIGFIIAALLVGALWLLHTTPRRHDARVESRRSDDILERVRAARSAKEFAEAEDALAQAEALQPGSPTVPYGRGLLLARQGRHHEAIAEFERALEHDPVATDVLYNLALSLAADGHAAESARVRARFDRARDYERRRDELWLRVKNDPDRADLWRRVLALANEYGDAELGQIARQRLEALGGRAPTAP